MTYDDVLKENFTEAEFEDMMRNDADDILNNRHLFRWGLEHLFEIQDKHENIVKLKLKKAQRMFLDAYYDRKETATEGQVGARMIILKSRQQGMSTLIAAICLFEMMLRDNRSSLIVAHEKGKVADKLFKIYERYLTYFPIKEWDRFKLRDGDGYKFHNDSNIDVDFEKPKGVVGLTTQFLHLSEAGRFRYLDTFLGSFMPGMPKLPLSTAILESTAEKSGDAFHTMWQEAERGNSLWTPVFYPWYIDEDNVLGFSTTEAKRIFRDDLQYRDDDTFGNEIGLLEEYGEITLEHLHARRELIKELPHGLASFKREYPTTPEEAFMGVNQPVFDIRVLREYEKTQVREPVLVGQMHLDLMDMASQKTSFEEAPHGIIKVYKRPHPQLTYIVGSDHSEGISDFNAALVASQHPFEIVAEMVGYDGYNPIPRDFARQMYHLGKWYNEAWICPECNPPGNTVIDLLLEWDYSNLISETMIFPDKVNSMNYGWRNTAITRKQALERFRETIKNMGIGIPSIKVLRQLEYFCTVSTGTSGTLRDQAIKKGQHRAIGANVDEYCDDMVFAALGLEHARQALGPPELQKMSVLEGTRRDQAERWTEETLPTVESLFGEPVQGREKSENWQDFA